MQKMGQVRELLEERARRLAGWVGLWGQRNGAVTPGNSDVQDLWVEKEEPVSRSCLFTFLLGRHGQPTRPSAPTCPTSCSF